MKDFFDREDVKELQEIQKRFHWTHPEAKSATAKMKSLATKVGAAVYFH